MATVFVTGNLTKDPEVRKIGNGLAVAFTIAASTNKKLEDGTYMANYYECLLYGKPGETFLRLCQKGTRVTVHGELMADEYKKKDGTMATALKIIVEGKIEYQKNLKTEDGSSTIRETKAKPDYERIKARPAADDYDPW